MNNDTGSVNTLAWGLRDRVLIVSSGSSLNVQTRNRSVLFPSHTNLEWSSSREYLEIIKDFTENHLNIK